ncbi:uncharacterized protein THITE_2010769, partial [Thermothielavioides terrestris NRRL 8126]
PPRPGQNRGHKVRRPRAARACDLCRAKKNKCDELYPSCTYCRSKSIMAQQLGKTTDILNCYRYVRHLEALVDQLTAANRSRVRDGSESQSCDSITCIPPLASPGHYDDYLGTTQGVATLRTGTRQGGGQEVSGVNRHTRNVEFYGRSSSVALLSRVQRSSGEHAVQTEEGADADADSDGTTIVSSLHNPVFTPQGESRINQRQEDPASVTHSHYPQCRGFLEGFFSSIHYIHPVIDKAHFFRRCELLWSGTDAAIQQSSFAALYYSILSLGALVGVRDDEPVDGIPNLQWSRKFFDEARSRCNRLGMVTDLDMVQCYLFMAKVCQNELNPHWSYMYIGLAVRTALAMGINREPGPGTKKDPAELRAEARTWWQFREISFAMGRPDTLGADPYHNRRFPLLDPTYCAIIKPMVDFARITRKVCLGIYLQDSTTARTVALANQIERELDEWVDGLPGRIRPRTKPASEPETLRSSKEPRWVKRQKLVLLIRYHNLRILLFGSLLLTSTSAERAAIPQSVEAVQKCLESAKQTIQVIYDVYQHHAFFHTWFYNTTYTVFAASIILVYVTQEASEGETAPLLKLVGMAVEILETMDECVVAAKAAQMLR